MVEGEEYRPKGWNIDLIAKHYTGQFMYIILFLLTNGVVIFVPFLKVKRLALSLFWVV